MVKSVDARRRLPFLCSSSLRLNLLKNARSLRKMMMMMPLSLSLSLSLLVVVLDSQILVRAKEIQPERDETEEDWREEEENARAEKRDAETRVIETRLSSSRSSSIEIPNGRTSRVTNYLKAQSNTHNSNFSLSLSTSLSAALSSRCAIARE